MCVKISKKGEIPRARTEKNFKESILKFERAKKILKS